MMAHVFARSESDEAIQASSRQHSGLLRFARNDDDDWLFDKLIEGSHLPGQTGLRFSAKAFSPSLASSVIAVSAIWLSV